MKKTRLSTRIMAMVLVVLMTVQLLPLGAFATFGDLQAHDPGVDLSTLKLDDAINWPIKVYDYLSDGMLFEWMDTNTTAYSSSPTVTMNWRSESGAGEYGGGQSVPVTEEGLDFTSKSTWNGGFPATDSDNDYAGYTHMSTVSHAYTLTETAAVPFTSPKYMRIKGDGSNSGSLNITNFTRYTTSTRSTEYADGDNIRYMVIVYKSSGVADESPDLMLESSYSGWKYFHGKISFTDTTSWTAKVIDLKSMSAHSSYTSGWTPSSNWSTYGQKITSVYMKLPTLKSSEYLDISHVGFFATKTEADNYGADCVAFDNEPGEHLLQESTTTYTHSYVTPVNRSDYLNNIFTLNWCWKTEGTTPKMFDGSTESANTWYGMDFTTHSTVNGWKTNAYTTDTFWTWSNGTNVTLKNTINNVTRTESFSMSKIEVEQKTQSNGAQYVTLTTSGPSKILLSKFREDHQQVQEGYVPLTADVNYMVLVYRPHGLSSSDKYGLWAQGYLDSSSPDSHKTANQWKYAGLTKTSDWTLADNVNQLSFSDTSGWQYVVVPVSETITEKDSNMKNIDRIANLGLYLPTMTDGKSLDIAYVSYFRSSQFDTAHAFGANAVNYMNAEPKVTQDVNTSKTYTSSRKWYGGGNKSFGMLYSSGGGQFWPSGNGGGDSTSTDQYNYGYNFDTWMIGYRTNAYSSNSFNTPRKNPVTGEAYTAKYTSTTSTVFDADATGTTNNIYFLGVPYGTDDGNSDNGDYFDTSVLPFDGYDLLETVVEGVMTAGLLEGGLQTVTVNGVNYRVPVYRQETVEYIAYNLLYGLRIPQKDSSGNYNTRYIKGTESTKFGGVDLNGDGDIGKINYDGDSRNGNELDEASVDLATALRHELGLTPRLGNSVNVMATESGVDSTYATFSKQMGTYEETLAKSKMLFGEFSDCRNAIDTAMDAAYYLLNNIFISNSYNQHQDDYDYLTLSSAQVNALGHDGYAYVFDAGFTTGKTDTYGNTFTDDGTNKSAISYSPYSAEGGTGTISMEGVTGKTRFDYGKSGTSWTTRFPFLPITDAEGDFAGQTQSYYYLDDAQRVYTEGSNSYKDRNFNYVIASNGEFVYREEDNLFFEFEGDDDVYLFINGELVLDIGGAHSITSVYIDVNDYVNAAATALAGLEKYGYHKDMPIDQFDEWISAANIQYLDEEFNATGESVANTFTADQIAEYKRQHRLNLSDGQICQFDFYYMERHGWGANMRIVTNMHITDPSLAVDKSAHQYGEEIEYGGVIDPTASVEYKFKLTNTGNTKLYNLTWRDDVLGITMDPTNGLVVNEDMNGIYVMNSSGGYLQAKDLTARVTGTDIDGNETDFMVTFDEVDGDGGQGALKKFLQKLESNDGTQSGYDDAEVTNAGSGLWVGGSVQFGGMFYMLTPEQTDDGMVDNTVYLTATTRVDPATVGCRTLRSDDSHRLYTNGFPIHYQWAGHEIFMNLEHLLAQATIESDRDGSQLSLYEQFFNRVTIDTLITQPCDKFGRVGGDYSDFLNKYSDPAGHNGYLINYDEPGVHTFYLLMYMKTGLDDEGNSTDFSSGTYNASDIGDGYYAILRSQVFVADVEDSVYILDYGLSTESLDADGLLFKDDYLFGRYGTIRAKLMGITDTEPSFRYPSKQDDATKTGIYFTALDDTRIYTNDGFYNANLSIPEGGKDIAYDANKDEYTLTGVGTTTITAVLPTTTADVDPWATPYLYYWYDDGTTGPTWPGTPMQKLGAGQFVIDIPADVSNVIINNGSAALKTNDLSITPGLESTITVTVSDNNVVSTKIDTIIEEVTMHVKVPEDWGDVYLHHWHDDGESTEFPGDQLTEVDENGYYTIKLHGDVTNLLINNGNNGKQTGDLTVYAGKEAWIDVSDTVTGTTTDEDGNVTNTYCSASVKYTLSEGFTVHASVPAGWKDTVYLYYWRTDGSKNAEWPGEAMTKGELWYTYDKLVPADVSQIIITDGTHQTVDLSVTPGLETWIMVQNSTTESNGMQKYTANVAYGSENSSTGLTFTPTDFMDEANEMWMAITVHGTNATPSALNVDIDIHNEVQMYKKITVLPASVVYYEDTFGAVNYDKTTDNSFTYHGNGSGQLSQSIDQDQPYGQDATYQDGENDLYSGDSLTEVGILDADSEVVATFDFVGTGFEIIGRTTAFDYGSVMVRVYNSKTYTADAYDNYLAASRKYLAENTKYLAVGTAYSAAVSAWEQACASYDNANAAYGDLKEVYASVNEAKALLDEAIASNSADVETCQQTYDDLCANYQTGFAVVYALFEAYENDRAAYEQAVADYQTALQTYTGTDSSFAISSQLGGCSFTYSDAPADMETALVLGSKPGEPAAPESLTTMTAPTLPESPFVTTAMVITQFDHGADGGAESLNQVPIIRVKGLDSTNMDGYTVEIVGQPTYTFDANYNITGVEPTSLYIDGIRVYEPLAYYDDCYGTKPPYTEKETDATVNELRDLIAQGIVGVGVMENSGLSLSTGTVTWTESLTDNDFSAANKETYTSVKVDSTNDYLIQGPNNEVYMEGNATNSALVFYVKETTADVHELQISVRGLDYGRYYGAGSTGLNAQLQYGILTESGYEWKNLVQVVSGTEQYYSIPYSECPVDTEGRYQIVLRAVNPTTQTNAMVSYTNLKINGLTIEKLDNLGEGSVVYYQNGFLVKPEYELVIIEDSSFADVEVIPFNGNELTMKLERDWTYVYVRSTLSGETYGFYAKADPGAVTSATMWRYDDNYGDYSRYTLDIQKADADEITFTIKQSSLDSLELSYCIHSYGEGVVAREPNCSITGIMAYHCTKCDHIKKEPIATNDTHHYSGGICKYCGAQEPKYYLVGYINGKNYGCEGDYLNMGEYLFVDGKLNVRFEKDSYVYLKADGNAAWYMVPAYATTDTATFYDTTTGDYTEKMYVPCGVDLIFTLTVNDDGSLTLHYEEPCVHDWSISEVTWAPTCTTDGERTYTCSKCGQTKTELLPASGHDFVNGVCANGCGEIEQRTIYFKNTDGWENVYLYAWVDGGAEVSAWPGDAMEWVEGDIYKATVPGNLMVVFNNGSGTQTENQDIPDYADMFDWSSKTWVNHSGEVDYYLVGSINGVDYGIGDNENNMGAYKFVDGKLTATFDKESYVIVKTTGNTAWYMAQTYCDTFSATLYNSTTGASEKMFVPAGANMEFTLTVNDDDTLSLVVHSWGGVVTKDPTCTETGEKTYTCYLCNDSYKEILPATGHSFVDDVCTVCGEVNTRIVYFHNTAGWENVYVYAFTEGTPATEYTGVWPGVQMNLVEGKTDLYYYEISAKANSVVFNNGSGKQTDNLRAPTDENNKFTYGANVWSTVDAEVELPEVEYLYLDPGDWAVDSAWFAAYFFGNGDAWVKMTDSNGDGIYECEKPADYPNVIFCRMNKDATEANWDNKWNQTVDETIPTDGSNLFTVTNPWSGTDGKGEGTWSTYTCDHSYSESITTAATCTTAGVKTFTCSKCGDGYTEEIAATGHSYTEEITTAATCTTAGVKTFTCGNCGDSYTEEIAATGHSYVDGTCENCGGTEVSKVYLVPGSDWAQTDAWFAAYFFNNTTGLNTWVKMTDDDGDGTYECEIPEGYPNVIFCRMSNEKTDLSWDSKWNQTADQTLPTDGKNLFTITGPWDGDGQGATGTWSTYGATDTECEHSYTEAITTAATCTTAGVKTFTCDLCGDSYTEEIAATGEHTYVDGTCSVCGAAETEEPEVSYITVYFQNNWQWTDVCAYVWTDDGAIAEWPGTAATFYVNDGTYDIYSVTIPEGAKLIFNGTKNDGSGSDQSPDITDATDGDCYWMTWSDGNAVEKDNIENVLNSAACEHSYSEAITTAATCTTAGVKTFTCANCGDSYTEEIAATGHTYVDGTCSNCGAAEPTEETILYLVPGSDWAQSDAWFAAYFFGNGDTWVKMTDEDGDGTYQCVQPAGYTSVIFCRMNSAATELSWDSKWNQTADQTLPTDGNNLFTISGPWDGDGQGATGTWSTYVATASYSLRSVRKTTVSDTTIYGDEDVALNLYSISQQMSSDVVYGQPDVILPGEEVQTGTGSVDIGSASLVLSDDICMNYYVTVPENAQNVYMTFQLNGETTTVTDYTVAEDGRYVFRFSGINAQKMGDDICATLYATVGGVQLTDCVEAYSVRAYCVSQLNKFADNEKLVRLISDLLVYGAKNQIYQGYKTDALVTDGLELSPSTFTELDASSNKLSVQGEADESVRYSGVTLVLGNKVLLRLTVRTDDPSAFTYTVSTCGVDTVYTAEDLVEAGDGKYYLYFDALKATGFDQTVTASIQCDGETVSQIVSYSVNSYILKNQNAEDEALRELVQAIYNYGRSASDYAG